MKKVVFQDTVTGQSFLVETSETAETVLWSDGNTYPVIKVEMSTAQEVEAPPPLENIQVAYTKREFLH